MSEKQYTCDLEAAVHANWVLLKDGSPVGTFDEMLTHAEHEAITVDTLAGGDGSAVERTTTTEGDTCYEIEDDAAAGASLVRWVIREVNDDSRNEGRPA